MANKKKNKKKLPRRQKPRVLIITPEIAYLPLGMRGHENHMAAKAGGLADVSASLVATLHNKGADVHVAMPNYRKLFSIETAELLEHEMRVYRRKLSQRRIHLAEDRVFYYCRSVYSTYYEDNSRVALAFQREVINNIIGEVSPDLIHCNDWMTGLVPAVARRMGIPCLFTIHNIHTSKLGLAEIEDAGIDAAEFWKSLYFGYPPANYEETRATNKVDLLASAVFAAHFVNTVSPTFLKEVVLGQHQFVEEPIRREIEQKVMAGCAVGILNAPDDNYHPLRDPVIPHKYDVQTQLEGKRQNKRLFQEQVGLRVDADAPVFFWPSRIDNVQKGCELLAHILHDIVRAYDKDRLQVAFVADGPFERHFRDVIRMHDFDHSVVLHPFNEKLSRLGYAGSDFVLMPSSFEPCGLPQMIGALYGTLPVVHDTGGLHDTVSDLDVTAGTGNGFTFNVYDAGGLRWAIDQAMVFWRLPADTRAAQIERVMSEAEGRFTHRVTADSYIEIYEEMLDRPLMKR